MSLPLNHASEHRREFRGPAHVRNVNGPPQLHKRSGQPDMQPTNVVLRFLPEDVRMQRHVSSMVDSSSAASERSLPSLCGSPMPPLEAGLPPLPPLPSPEPSLSPPPPPTPSCKRSTSRTGYSISVQREETKEIERERKPHFSPPKIKKDPNTTAFRHAKMSQPPRPQSKPFRLHPVPTTGLPFVPPNIPETQSIHSSKKKKHGGEIAQSQLRTGIMRGLQHMNRVLGQMRDEIIKNRADWRQEVVVLKQRVSKLSGRMTRLEKHNAVLRRRHQMMHCKRRKQFDPPELPVHHSIAYVTTQATHHFPAGSIALAPPASILRALPIHQHAPPPLSPGENFHMSDRTSPGNISVRSGTPTMAACHDLLGGAMSSMELDQLDADSDSMFD